MEKILSRIEAKSSFLIVNGGSGGAVERKSLGCGLVEGFVYIRWRKKTAAFWEKSPFWLNFKRG